MQPLFMSSQPYKRGYFVLWGFNDKFDGNLVLKKFDKYISLPWSSKYFFSIELFAWNISSPEIVIFPTLINIIMGEHNLKYSWLSPVLNSILISFPFPQFTTFNENLLPVKSCQIKTYQRFSSLSRGSN